MMYLRYALLNTFLTLQGLEITHSHVRFVYTVTLIQKKRNAQSHSLNETRVYGKWQQKVCLAFDLERKWCTLSNFITDSLQEGNKSLIISPS